MRILVRGTNWIGDAVMTIPALRKLRGLFPDARLTLQTRAWAEDIFRDSGIVDEIIGVAPFLQQVQALRQSRSDLAVLFPNSFRSALEARVGGAGRIFGYATEYRSFLLTDAVAVPAWKDKRHEVYYYLELISAVEQKYFSRTSETADVEPQLVVNETRRRWAHEFLRDRGVDLHLRIVVLAPGSTNSNAKRWHAGSFAQLSDRLTSELGANVVLMGSADEKETSRKVAMLASHPTFDLTGKTDLAQAAAILSEVDLLVSNDMGLAHLAPAVDTATIVIFGPTDPITTRPFSDIASVVSANVECSPCLLRECPIDHRCMTRITADDVFERAKIALEAPVMTI